MGNINPEIQAFKSAVYGEDVRDAIISLSQKLNAIVEQVVIDTDRDILVGYKNIKPSDYIDPTDNKPKLALVDVAAVFRTNMGDNYFADMPTENAYTIINTQRSPGTNLQIAFGFSTLPNLYWRTVRRDTHEPEMEWVTDNLDVDTTLSVSGAAAEAGAVGYALSEKVDNYNGTIGNGLAIGTTVQGTQNNNKALSVGEANRAANNSVAVGYYCEAGNNSMAVGNGLEASTNQLVIGEENAPDTNHDYYFIVGKGNYENAHTLDKNGNAWFAGNIKVGGTSAASGSELATINYVDTGLSGKANSGDIPTISTDISADASSDVKTASPKAVKTYADGLLVNAGVFVADGATSTATKINRIGNIVYCTTVVIKQTAFGLSDIPIGTIKNVGQPRTMTLATCYTYNDEGGSSPHPAVVRFVPYTNNTTRVRITPTDANDSRVMINAFFSVADN